jgi:hypothetical protein
MNAIRILFLGLAVMLPTSWTIAHAADETPAAEGKEPKKAKKSKKTKKAEEGEKKAE